MTLESQRFLFVAYMFPQPYCSSCTRRSRWDRADLWWITLLFSMLSLCRGQREEKCRIAEVARDLWRLSKPALCPKQARLQQLVWAHAQLGFEHLCKWKLQKLSGQPGPVSDHHYGKKKKSFLCWSGGSLPFVPALDTTVRRLAVSSYTLPLHGGVREGWHNPPEPNLLLKAKQPQFSQHFLIGSVP